MARRVAGSLPSERLLVLASREATLPDDDHCIAAPSTGEPSQPHRDGDIVGFEHVAWGDGGLDEFELGSNSSPEHDPAELDALLPELHVRRKRGAQGPHRHYEWIAYGGSAGIVRVARMYIDVLE